MLPIYSPSELAPGEVKEPEVNSRGQFRIKCPDGKQRWYTRCTTYIKCLDDRSLLEAWKNRIVLAGVYVDTDVQRDLLAADHKDRDQMNGLAERAFTAGDGYLKAEKGTRLHKLAELYDTGQPLPADLTEEEVLSLKTYVQLCEMHNLQFVSREKRVVVDHLKVTGTPDAVAADYRCLDGKVRNVIADLKTKPGEINFGRGEMSMQLGMYSDGEEYEDDGSPTGKRTPFPVEVSRDIGLVLHVAQDNSVPSQLFEVDIRLGSYGISLAGKVREWRNISKSVFHEVPPPQILAI